MILPKTVKQEAGTVPILVMVAVIGLVAFLVFANVAGFKNKLFSSLYPKPTSHAQSNYTSGEILIQFKAGINEEAKTNARGKVKATQKQLLKKEEKIIIKHNKEDLENAPHNPNNGDLEVDTIPADQSVTDVITQLQQDPNVAFAIPNITDRNQ